VVTVNAQPVHPSRSLRDAVVDYLHQAVFLPVMLAHALVFWSLLMPAAITGFNDAFHDRDTLIGTTLQAAFDTLGWPLMDVGQHLDLAPGWQLTLWAANSVLWGAVASFGMWMLRGWRERGRGAS
jgi:hypothetical protein